jgi:hypothetical protein
MNREKQLIPTMNNQSKGQKLPMEKKTTKGK